jgi:Tfp pilus assembly protein FimT
MTLLELILVMVILSTVLAMAAPSLRGFFASRRTQDTAAQILALTQLARSQAICEGIIIGS